MNSTPDGVMTAISSSPMKTTSRVWARIAGMSDATKNSFSPSPTTIGGPLRTVDDLVGVVGGDQHQREEAAHVEQRPPDRVLEPVALRLALDQVRDDLGVGLGHERVPLLLKLPLQIEVVLDDPVVDDDDAPGAVAMRMRVLLGRPAVRRPARVADAVVPVERVDREDLFEARQLAGAAPQLDLAVAHDRDARRVVAAILEPPQPVDQNRQNLLLADVADDPAHVNPCMSPVVSRFLAASFFARPSLRCCAACRR